MWRISRLTTKPSQALIAGAGAVVVHIAMKFVEEGIEIRSVMRILKS
jgi:hypothetical protein